MEGGGKVGKISRTRWVFGKDGIFFGGGDPDARETRN